MSFSTATITLALVLALCIPAYPAEPAYVADPEQFSNGFVHALSTNGSRDAAKMVADAIGKPDVSDSLQKVLQVFDGKTFDFSKKVVDRDFNNALRQIVVYSKIANVGFTYFRFNFKMSKAGWILANFTFKDETNELFPKDFITQ
jgi:hypothetical protein